MGMLADRLWRTTAIFVDFRMASAEFDISDIWTAAGIILGFQINALLRRVQREAAAGDQLSDRSRSEAGYRLNRLSIADYLSVLAIFVTSFGVFVLPALGITA
jgi:hypothetical protein